MRQTNLHPEILAALSADHSTVTSLGNNTARARFSWRLAAGPGKFVLGQIAQRRVLFRNRQCSHGFAVTHIVEVVKGIGWRLRASASSHIQYTCMSAPRQVLHTFHEGYWQGSAQECLTASGDSLRLVAGVFLPLAPSTSLCRA